MKTGCRACGGNRSSVQEKTGDVRAAVRALEVNKSPSKKDELLAKIVKEKERMLEAKRRLAAHEATCEKLNGVTA